MDNLDQYWITFDTVKSILADRGITDVDIIRRISMETFEKINNKNVGHEAPTSTDSNAKQEHQHDYLSAITKPNKTGY